MGEFVLRTPIERRLYVESLLHCLNFGTLSEAEVCKDLHSLVTDGSLMPEGSDWQRTFAQRCQGIVRSYKAKIIDSETATASLFDLLNQVAASANS